MDIGEWSQTGVAIEAATVDGISCIKATVDNYEDGGGLLTPTLYPRKFQNSHFRLRFGLYIPSANVVTYDLFPTFQTSGESVIGSPYGPPNQWYPVDFRIKTRTGGTGALELKPSYTQNGDVYFITHPILELLV